MYLHIDVHAEAGLGWRFPRKPLRVPPADGGPSREPWPQTQAWAQGPH